MADLIKMSEQYEGLPMESLIGGPLEAAAKAQINLAKGTADYINTVGFKPDGSIRNIDFKYEATEQKSDGTPFLKEVTVSIPLLAVVPIPNLQIDRVDITFDMEVKESIVDRSTADVSSTTKRGVGADEAEAKQREAENQQLAESVQVFGQTSSHKENTRESDNSAKYHVEVHASNHGMPEGLQRVMDMIASSVAPRKVLAFELDDRGEKKGRGEPILNPADQP